MEIIHADTYEDALSIVRDRKAAPAGAGLCYEIVKSEYEGYSVVAIEPELLCDMLIGDIPPIPELRSMIAGAPDSVFPA